MLQQLQQVGLHSLSTHGYEKMNMGIHLKVVLKQYTQQFNTIELFYIVKSGRHMETKDSGPPKYNFLGFLSIQNQLINNGPSFNVFKCVNFSFPRLLCSCIRPNVRDRQTSDAHHRLMPPTLGVGHNNSCVFWNCALSGTAFSSPNWPKQITAQLSAISESAYTRLCSGIARIMADGDTWMLRNLFSATFSDINASQQ